VLAKLISNLFSSAFMSSKDIMSSAEKTVPYCENVFGLFALLHIVLILNLIKICKQLQCTMLRLIAQHSTLI